MSAATLQLKALFCEDPLRPLAESVDLGPCLEAVDKAGGAARAALPGLRKAFQDSIDDVMAVELGEVLDASWKKVGAVAEAMKATREKPGATAVVPLLDHRITSNHEPAVELFLGDQRLCELSFKIALSLQLKGVSLAIAGGRIEEVRSGVCLGDGEFSMAGQSLIKRKTPEFALPGKLRFAGPDEGEARVPSTRASDRG